MPEPMYTTPSVVSLDPETGKWKINQEWASAYSGRNRFDRVALNRKIYNDVQQYRARQAAKVLRRAQVPGYDIPDTDNVDWNTRRVQADYLNFQIQNQGRTAQQFGEQDKGPSGWRGVLSDALDSPPGHLLQRGLDVIGRPAYAIAEGIDATIKPLRGESPEHKGWYRTGDDETTAGWWENRETGEVRFEPEWEDVSGGPNIFTTIRGVGRGLTGKNKTSIGQVLRENDILEGKPAAVAGFVGDIALDPTTYLTFGTSSFARKGTGALSKAERATIEETARSTAREAVESGVAKGPLAERRAFNTALREGLEQAGVTRRPTRQIIDDINSSYGSASIERAMRDRVTKALDDPFWRRSTQRQIASQARKAYTAERRALDEVVDPAVRKQVGIDALRQAREEFTSKTGADVMDEIATRKALRENTQLDIKLAGKRVASSRTAGRAIQRTSRALRGSRAGTTLARTFRTDAEIGDALHRIQRQSYNTSAAQFEAEAKAVKEAFTSLGLSKKQREQISRAIEGGDTKGFTTSMIEGLESARQFFRNAFDREVEAGALSQSDFIDNYLYHVYREPNFSRGIGSWVRPTGRGAQKFRTLDEAAKAGARPLTDIADILVHRLAKSHRVASSHLMMRTIAARFGVDLAGGKISSKALRGLADRGLLIEGRNIGGGAGRFFEKGVYFDQDVASSLAKMEQIFSNDELISRFGRLFDQFQARIKFLQTAPNPGFHVRNTMSDMFVNFLDGVTSIRPYQQAAKLVTGGGDLNKIKITLRNGRVLDGDDIVQLYDGMGLRAGFFHAEAGIVPGMGSKLATGSSNAIRRFSEIREDTMRMAHFIDSLKKSTNAGRVEEVAEIAAKRVRKYNFDYQDLTNVERKLFRRAVPFYTFMRKNVPLMLESYLTKPGRMIVPNKANRALAAFLGNDNVDEPLPGMISTTPEWISRIPGVELTEAGPENDTVFMQPDMPYNQLEELFGGFTQGNTPVEHIERGTKGLLRELLLEQSTPLLRAPAEYATQTDLSTGADQRQTALDAVINQFPVGRLVQRPLANAAPGLFMESDRPGSPQYTVNIGGQKVKIGENVANYITGMGFRKVTPERMKSELRRRQDIIEALLEQMKAQSVEDYQQNWDERNTG